MNNKTLLATFDCCKEHSPSEYFSCGEVKVVKGPAGRYREAEAKPLSRFGYRFQIKNIGRPHLAVIRYPDDKRRFMIINDGTTYDMSTGITSGHAYPMSNKVQEVHLIFWPRWEDCSLCFMTWGHGEPAAVTEIAVYELSDLPELEGKAIKGSREFGIQYEDPCGIGMAEGASNYEEWLDRVVTYAKHTGQKYFSYPICWYHGPFFPSRREPSDAFNCIAAKDRKMYGPWTTSPPDWPAVLLKRFEKEGLEFQGVLTLLRLGSLMKKMNIDLDAIKAGAETINNMLWNDQVQAGTNDWTPTYNARNYENLLNYAEEKKKLITELHSFSDWVYGEKSGGPYHPGPIFNPLHPVVQEAIVGFAAEIGQRYGKYSAFKGIAITMWAPTLIWFGSIHAGYDDYTTELFEKETGVKIPVEKNLPNRFSKRYEFLTFNCKPLWVSWRCRKIRELICKMRDALVKGRKDLKLTLNLWSEPYIPALYGNGGPQQQIFARPNGKTAYKEAGLDISLFENEPNIRLDLQTEGGGRDRSNSNQENAPMEWFFMYRDHDFLDQETLDAVHAQTTPGVFIFNAWHEAWGDHKWFRCDPNDPNLFMASYAYGKKAEGNFRLNSYYPKDGFWWDSQLRITAAYPPFPHFMEQYAHAVAELDACRITRGGLFLDKAHSEELRDFARAYRALPAEKFETVGFSTDPVAVRTLIHGGKRYFYLVNREYYPIKVHLSFNKKVEKLFDLASEKTFTASKQWTLELNPYELKSFSTSSQFTIQGFTVTAPTQIINILKKESKQTVVHFAKIKSKGKFIPGMDEIQKGIESALAEGRFSWLRHALTGYQACKCRELVKQLK